MASKKIHSILVELDYKGSYSRFALTEDEFKDRYPETWKRFGPIREVNSDTISPLVHIWFAPCTVGNMHWDKFFSDMTWGLPQSDVDNGNAAYVDMEQFGSLKKYIQKDGVNK